MSRLETAPAPAGQVEDVLAIDPSTVMVGDEPIRPQSKFARIWRPLRGPIGLVVVVVSVVAIAMVPGGLTQALLLVAAVIGLLLAIKGFGRMVSGHEVEAGLWLSGAWLVLLAGSALLADVLPLAEARNTSLTLQTPSLLQPDFFSAHPLGTDKQGLDLLGGIIYGARVSLLVGVGAALCGLIIGGVVGLVAGFYRRKVDASATFMSDLLLAFPSVILVLAVVTVLGPSIVSITLGLGIVSIPIYLRLARVNTMANAQREFVTAARSLGAQDWRILFKELVPCILPVLLSYSFIVVALLIVAEASLSFLGFSIARPEPTWGNLIAAGQNDFDKYPNLVFAPGVFLFVTVFSLNRVGEATWQRWQGRR